MLTVSGRNKRRRHESFTPDEAEEPVAFRRRRDGGSTEAAGCAGRCVAKKNGQILYGVTDSVTLALAVPSGREGLQPFS